MRTLALCLGLLFSSGLYAQRTTPHLTGTFPSVIHPAGNGPGVTRVTPSVVNPGGGGVHLVVPGAAGNQGVRRFTDRNGRVLSYMAYPVYIGGYYDTPYIAPQAPYDSQGSAQPVTQNITVIYPPQSAPASAMINPYVPGATSDNTPVISGSDAQESNPDPTHYLIAFKDHTIYSAVAYWVDGDTLHYFTSGNTHNQVSLSLVDRDLTARLNKDSGVEVKLPAPKQ